MAIAGYALALLGKLDGALVNKFLNTATGEGQPGGVKRDAWLGCEGGPLELGCMALSCTGMDSSKLSWDG